MIVSTEEEVINSFIKLKTLINHLSGDLEDKREETREMGCPSRENSIVKCRVDVQHTWEGWMIECGQSQGCMWETGSA